MLLNHQVVTLQRENKLFKRRFSTPLAPLNQTANQSLPRGRQGVGYTNEAKVETLAGNMERQCTVNHSDDKDVNLDEQVENYLWHIRDVLLPVLALVACLELRTIIENLNSLKAFGDLQ